MQTEYHQRLMEKFRDSIRTDTLDDLVVLMSEEEILDDLIMRLIFFRSSECGSVNVCRYMLEHSTIDSWCDPLSRQIAFKGGSSEGHVEILKLLLEKRVQVYGMYKGLNSYGLAIGALEAGHQVYEGEYTEAIKHLAITGAYIGLPMVMATAGVPYAGVIFVVGITAYSAYHLVSNTHALYMEYTSENNPVKSSEAYAYLYATLVKAPLQYVYESEAPSIAVENHRELIQEEEYSLDFFRNFNICVY
ncbi:hypothetical protein EDM53_02150 [Rickettsiales endosymbiont of Peranema trichophorum]|uniref:hypothetical protein n=1 Tax=Rickettsiales endosymbiont of Peranema trichophorum TaxID=2486577 RepID=UPI001022DE4A|nr:hypothetical protein [Rickettsiales endosymbiont of Peranema trichophorum]RZI47388.1 hypothetical protein EDM53_02150 [Rickettsiales endosymbiont of Peranema trichophorum]